MPKVIWHSLEIQGKEVKDKPDLLKRVCSNVQKLTQKSLCPRSTCEQSTEKQSSWAEVAAGNEELETFPSTAN